MSEMMYLNDAPNIKGKKDFIDTIRDFVKKQKKTRGYTLPLAVGENTFNLTISGSARVLLGFALCKADNSLANIGATAMKLTINNEIIIDSVNPNFFGSNFTNEGYYYFPRPLNGSDTVILVLTGTTSEQIASLVIYYI
jgi:hypothetical protein